MSSKDVEFAHTVKVKGRDGHSRTINSIQSNYTSTNHDGVEASNKR